MDLASDSLTRAPSPFGRGDVRRIEQSLRIRNSPSSGDSASDLREHSYPPGYNPLCPTCSFLSAKYGPDDGELFIHCRNYYGKPDWLTDGNHYLPGDSSNPNLHEYYPAG